MLRRQGNGSELFGIKIGKQIGHGRISLGVRADYTVRARQDRRDRLCLVRKSGLQGPASAPLTRAKPPAPEGVGLKARRQAKDFFGVSARKKKRA